MRRLYFCIAIMFFLGTNVYAQQLVWQYLNGPRSSDVRSFAEAPNGDLYILVYSYHETELDELYRSEDDGRTWDLVDSFEDALIYDVAVAPDGTLYLGSHFNIRRSTDRGATWEEKNGQFGFTYKFLFGSDGLIVAPGAFNGKYTNNAYSTDNGVTWQVLDPPLTNGAYITDIAVHSLGAIFASTYRNGIFMTTDNGASWTAIGDTLTEATWFLSINASGSLTAIADWRALVSHDGGTTWDGPGAEIGYIQSFAQDGDILIAGQTRDTVFSSLFLGGTWQPEFVAPQPGSAINALDFDSQGRMYISTQSGLYRKVVGEQMYEGLFFHSGAPIQPGRVAATPSNVLLVSCPGNGLFAADASGMSWAYTELPSPLYESPLSFEIDAGGTIYAFTRYGVYNSTNDGVHWGYISQVDSIAFTRNTAILSDGTLFAANDYPAVNPGFPGGIHYINAQNLDWPKVRFVNDTVLALAADGDDRLYASDGNAVFTSTDMGDTWTSVKAGEYTSIYAADDNSVYITGYNGMHVSNDGGMSWTELGFPYPAQVVAMAKDEQGHVYAALNGTVPHSNDGGIYASYDGGMTWHEENTGLKDFNGTYRCHDMVLDRLGHLVVALEEGVYRSSTPTSIDQLEAANSAALPAAYPNPAGSGTAVTLTWTSETTGPSKLALYSLHGQLLRTISIGETTPGKQSRSISTTGLPSGVYYYTIQSRTRTVSGTLFLH